MEASRRYRRYLSRTSWTFEMVEPNQCDVCQEAHGEDWSFGRPWLCEEHARELDLLW
jgi:hypothetical protein